MKKLLLLILVPFGSFSQNGAEDLVLKVQNEEIFYQERDTSAPYDENAPVSFDNTIHITLTNKSERPYLLVIDTTAFKIHDHIQEMQEEYNVSIDSNAIRHPSDLLFRPWLKVSDSASLPVTSSWFFYSLDYESDWSKERLEQMEEQNKQQDKAYDLYGHLETEDVDDMPEYYYKVKQIQQIIYPKETISFYIPVSLPYNHLLSIGERYKLKGDNSYKATVKMDNNYEDLEKILTQKDKDSLQREGIKIYNGTLKSNEIELLPKKH